MNERVPSNRQTTEQQRAHAALLRIKEIDERNEKFKKRYGAWARKLPALIQTNGLGQTLAFLTAKAKGSEDHRGLLYQHVSVWVCQQLKVPEQKPDLLEWIVKKNSGTYRRATTEAAAFTLWLRRFAEAHGWDGEDEDED